MNSKFTYDEYVHDEKFLSDYNAYQSKYAEEPRESDKVILGIVRERLARIGTGGAPTLMDIGCSTGNLLIHLRRQFADLALEGGDLADSSLDLCRRNPALAGVTFSRSDITALPADGYDLIVVNAVLYMFDEVQYAAALASLARALRKGGGVVVYDFAHEFGQDIEILEKTSSHPNGLRLCFRPMAKIRAAAATAGFESVEFRPFELPIDLPRSKDDSEIITYTRKDEHHHRMAFRGTLYQPWCHMIMSRD
jgi:SAM-dependent methyltransferase